MKKANDPVAEAERLDRFYDGEEPGEMPLAVLRAKGMAIPDDDAGLDDAALHAKLWEVLEGMATVGMFIDSTDHLSDRELYRYLVRSALVEETILPGEGGMWQLSPIGGGSEEDNEIYLRYYADDETREMWRIDFSAPLPARSPAPYDRDRLLPNFEARLFSEQ